MTIYNQNTVGLMDLGTGESNILPNDAGQLVSYTLAQRLEDMETSNPSLSRRERMDPFGRQFEKVGVDFQSNQPLYRPRSLKLDCTVSDAESLEKAIKDYAPAAA